MEKILDFTLLFLRKVGLPADLLDVVAISLSRRDAPRGGMGLLQEPRVRKVGHDVADGRRAQPFTAFARKNARTHVFPGYYEGLHHGGYNFPPTRPELYR